MKLLFTAFALLAFAGPSFAADSVPAVPPAASAPAAQTTDYCRFIGDDVHGKLQTAVITLKNDAGVTVDLIGAVHIADAAYYGELNTLFKSYEALLFELVDGKDVKKQIDEELKEEAEEKASGKPNSAKPHQVGKKRDLAFTILRGMMTSVGSFLHLEYQTDLQHGVDYRASNFVHADVSMAEFQRLQAEKGESWGTLFEKAMRAQLKRGHHDGDDPSGAQLLLALLGDSSGIKIVMARMLGAGAANDAMGFGADSVIVGERNRVALEVFDQQVKKGRKNLGIFYGAAHLSDMEKRLEARGYHRTAERWLTAWDIKPAAEEKK